DLEARPPGRLWDKSSRTALGVRVDSGATSPLANGDVILSLAGVATAGMPLEQLEQLGYATTEARTAQLAVVLRSGERGPRTLALEKETKSAAMAGLPGDPAPSPSEPTDLGMSAPLDDDELAIERVPYGNGDVVVVPIHDVRDDLGEALARALLREREKEA